MGLLDGKVAIVTGAGRGIGREHALLLAREGAAVMVNDLGGDLHGEGADPTAAYTVAEEIRSAGGRAEVNGGDVADWSAAEGLVASTVKTLGRLDILVNNAGILRNRMVFNMTQEEWDAVINVVLKGSFAPARFAAAYWRKQYKQTGQKVGGVIVNTTSESGLYGNTSQANYAAGKAGIVALSTVLARDLETIGVRVNSIAPMADTRMFASMRQGPEPQPKSDYDPLSPSAIAPLLVWLCSHLAEDVNGQVFAVGGARIQLIQGFTPVTQVDAHEQRWSVARIESLRSQLLDGFDTGIPPFLPSLEAGRLRR